jgi:hypothetical protein
MTDPTGTRAADGPSCVYCGSLAWTVREYGRVTHKESCPHRTEAWSQTYPKCEHRVAGKAVGWFS